MKLLLTSSGFTTQALVDACVRLTNKPAGQIHLAVINEGYAVEQGDHGWVIEELSNLRHIFGGTIELVNLLALDLHKIRDRIDQADIIYVLGGNTDYLMYVFQKTGFSDILPELIKSKVFIGSSAGSIVMGNRISTEDYQKSFGEIENYGVESYLGFCNFAIKPHLNSPEWPNNRTDKLLMVTENYTGTLYGLSDLSAVYINGDSVNVVGDGWVKITNGVKQ